ncbi:Leucine Rich repeat-containing protein [Nonomuraea solani]|uniref:Leucine Rich repeat-containing protein n=1 Tax=Nonomuraea solani TaxID=1144553 RepID=A0A1H6BKV3_9ACTN|nr:STM4015 family protein [Nonomuraea solani]SEG61007.1 Leucine Rich repeat-containing protein [Nonomuraea solani]
MTERPSHWDEYTESYAGLPVAFSPLPEESSPPDVAAWRIHGSDWEHNDSPKRISESFDWFFEHVDTGKVTAIVIGGWEDSGDKDSGEIVARLADNADRLPGLRSLFLGAMTPEENEISWIQQSDVTPLLKAYPRLERLEVRGGNGLGFEPVRHESLRTLRFESGGLPARVVRGVGDSDLPALEHLEIWFGDENYGGDSRVTDCAAVLTGERLPALRYLGLQNCPFADDLAAALAAAPVVARLEELNLSMSAFGDAGAEALLSGQPLTHLRRLDLDHHFVGEEMMARLVAALPGVEVLLTDRQSSHGDWLYVAVGE